MRLLCWIGLHGWWWSWDSESYFSLTDGSQNWRWCHRCHRVESRVAPGAPWMEWESASKKEEAP